MVPKGYYERQELIRLKEARRVMQSLGHSVEYYNARISSLEAQLNIKRDLSITQVLGHNLILN